MLRFGKKWLGSFFVFLLLCNFFLPICTAQVTDNNKSNTEDATILQRLFESVAEIFSLIGLDDASASKGDEFVNESQTISGNIVQGISQPDNTTLSTELSCSSLEVALCYVNFGFELCSTFGLCRKDSGGICDNQYFLFCGACACG